MSGNEARKRRRGILAWQAVALVGLVVVVLSAIAIGTRSTRSGGTKDAALENPSLDTGTPLSGRAPDFTLTDQLGRRVSLRSFRGRVVVLAFNDSQCTTVCPLTTTEMVDAKRVLGAAGTSVQLLGVDANPHATAVKDVRAYSEAHEMMTEWHFLTGSRPELARVWRAYHIGVQIERGAIDHTPALYVIDAHGNLADVYLTELAYAGVHQQAQILAHALASLLPGNPVVHSNLSYARISSLGPSAHASLPRVGGGTVALGPDGSPRLLLFFDAWDSEVTDLGTQMQALDRYAQRARAAGLPPLTAVDEASVEPSPEALSRFLARLGSPLAYPVAIDGEGRVADGYAVEDEPWLVLVSRSGQILWHYDVSTSGWLGAAALASQVRAALASTPRPPASVAAAADQLTGSPAPLAALHRQAAQIVGSSSALASRLQALRGYPVVINGWASWCTPCRSEFPMFAGASARYGRQVAFIGADSEDTSGGGRAFLAAHPVSYPSYETTTEALSSITPVSGLPTTIFLDRSGRVVHVHIGQYGAQGTLEEDIRTYALRG